MSRNVFDKIGDIKNNVRRNNFDWSHDNNFTTGLGRITPVFCEYCPPNSSLKINPTFGLRFMPMMFPVQTRVKAYLSFYRVPLRTLWKDYKDWISSPNDQNNDLEAPYISVNPNAYSNKGTFGVSGLADYLGVPITFVGAPLNASLPYNQDLGEYTTEQLPAMSATGDENFVGAASGKTVTSVGYKPFVTYPPKLDTLVDDFSSYTKWYLYPLLNITQTELNPSEDLVVDLTLEYISENSAISSSFLQMLESVLKTDASHTASFKLVTANTLTTSVVSVVKPAYDDVKQVIEGNRIITTINVRFSIPHDSANNQSLTIFLQVGNDSRFLNANDATMKFEKEYQWGSSSAASISAANSPYYTTGAKNENRVKLSAYPFRAYEAIYNAYIRNNKNNPFVLNGKEVYNKWITTDEGGADTTDYHLFHANWASDAFTTAVPSPQQGQAPLVGLTTYTKTMQLENGHTETKIGTALVDEDGKKYAVDFESNGESLKGVKYTELDSGVPVAPISNLYDVVTSGISINDFRNVNAYQRYLELNMFRGYSYKQIIEGRFDVNIKYDDLNMPEYLGGITRDVVINPITQTVQTNGNGLYDGALGSMAGNATCFGDSKATITCFCDEESIVMGLLSVVPMPVYTQVLPKYFLYRDRLDMFNPEFDHIGFQPILNKELCPVQTYAASPSQMDNVFGYQRPWYEYCQKVDTAHGLFKTQLRNFLINRVFSSTPELGADFTTVDEDTVNDVFSVTETTDKILGQIHFDITAKLPISRVVVPKLE